MRNKGKGLPGLCGCDNQGLKAFVNTKDLRRSWGRRGDDEIVLSLLRLRTKWVEVMAEGLCFLFGTAKCGRRQRWPRADGVSMIRW